MEFLERDTGLMQSISAAAQKKEALFDNHLGLYLLRAFYAGLLLTLPTIVGMMAWDTVAEGAPHFGKLFYAIIFPLGLMAIIFLNAELATSNMMYLCTSAHRKWLSWGKALTIITVCTLMNLVGAFFIGFLVSQSSTVDYFGADSALMSVANGKLSKDIWTLFIDAVLANIFVNVAIMGQMRLKNDMAKLFFVLGFIFLFVFAGYEHLIANFSIMGIAIFAGNHLDWGAVLLNWVVVFFGNLVGGGLIMGVGYSLLNHTEAPYRD